MDRPHPVPEPGLDIFLEHSGGTHASMDLVPLASVGAPHWPAEECCKLFLLAFSRSTRKTNDLWACCVGSRITNSLNVREACCV